LVIYFKNRKARNHLLKRGVVYTLRSYLRRTGRDWMTNKRGNKRVCNVEVSLIRVVSKDSLEELREYVPLSGFSSLEEWIRSFLELYNTLPDTLYLYRVVKVGECR